MRIAMCIPTCGQPTWQLFDSMARFQAYHYATHPDIAVDVMRPPRSLPVDVARSYLAERVLESEKEYSHLWFVDQDCAFLPGTLERLMSREVGIIGALCMIRGSEECPPMAFRGTHPEKPGHWMIAAQEVYDFARVHYDCRINAPQILETPPEGSLFAADVTGCHCLLIKRAVLESMEPPWFAGRPGQEDIYFCERAKRMGHTVHVDFSVLAGHATGTRTIGLYDFMAHALYMTSLEANIGTTE